MAAEIVERRAAAGRVAKLDKYNLLFAFAVQRKSQRDTKIS
jgi:hypothetical protein